MSKKESDVGRTKNETTRELKRIEEPDKQELARVVKVLKAYDAGKMKARKL